MHLFLQIDSITIPDYNTLCIWSKTTRFQLATWTQTYIFAFTWGQNNGLQW